jgi:uncharacterized protein (DUF2384 family)
MSRYPLHRDADETRELRCLIAEVVSEPDKWMDTPNDQLGGKKPNDLVGTLSEARVRELVRSIQHGMPT